MLLPESVHLAVEDIVSSMAVRADQAAGYDTASSSFRGSLVRHMRAEIGKLAQEIHKHLLAYEKAIKDEQYARGVEDGKKSALKPLADVLRPVFAEAMKAQK